MTDEEETKVLGFTFNEATEKFGRAQAKDMFFLSHYGSRKRKMSPEDYKKQLTKEEATKIIEEARKMLSPYKPTVKIIEEAYDENI